MFKGLWQFFFPVIDVEPKCSYKGCGKEATHRGCGRDDPHKKVGWFCKDHVWVVTHEGEPAFVAVCPDCSCWFGVGAEAQLNKGVLNVK